MVKGINQLIVNSTDIYFRNLQCLKPKKSSKIAKFEPENMNFGESQSLAIVQRAIMTFLGLSKW